MVVTFSKQYLMNELDLPDNAILDEICDTSRWSVNHSIVFADKGKFYRANYSVGATEVQDESPWEYENNVECTEVELRDIVVRTWCEK